MKKHGTALAGLAIIVWIVGQSAGETIFVSQSGTGDGSSSSSSRSANWFNNSGNWEAGAGKISAGDTVRLSGIITSNLNLQGSGSSGNYIVVDGTGATMSAYFYEVDKNYWKIQNCIWEDGFTNQILEIQGGTNGIFTNNYADNLTSCPIALYSNMASNVGQNMSISNNFIRTAATDIGDVQIDIIRCDGFIDLVIEGNYLEMRMVGHDPYSDSHDDIFQCYQKGGSNYGPPRNLTLRYNKFVMNTTTENHRSWTMVEALEGTNYVYGNVFLGINGAGSANGLSFSAPNGTAYFYNNTFVAKPGSCENTIGLDGMGYFRNNIVYAPDVGTMLKGSGPTSRDHNLWFGSAAPSISSETGGISNADPLFTNFTNNDFSLQTGSPAINAGANLGAPYDKAIALGATWPDPTLVTRSSTWDIGAYEYTSGTITAARMVNYSIVHGTKVKIFTQTGRLVASYATEKLMCASDIANNLPLVLSIRRGTYLYQLQAPGGMVSKGKFLVVK